VRGVGQIVRFNWPFYGGGIAALVAATVASAAMAGSVRLLAHSVIALAGFWMVASLVASWAVYDRSDLMRGDWIAPLFGAPPRTWINIHAGLDESSPALRRLFGSAGSRVFDIFDRTEMTESSILRARRLARNQVPAETVDYRHLPVGPATTDAALLLLSAHELRHEEARLALFRELARVLAPGGCVVVAEHLRNWANFLAFGPGFLHFHSRRTWRRAFTRTAFTVDSEWSITPFVRVFVLRRSS